MIDYQPVNIEAFQDALLAMPDRHPPHEPRQSETGFDADRVAAIFRRLPSWLRNKIAHEPEHGKRSEHFANVISDLFESGLSFNEVFSVAEGAPFARKYQSEGRNDLAKRIEDRRQDWEAKGAKVKRGQSARPAKPLTVYDAVEFEAAETPERKWLVPDYLPGSEVTLLGADGGTGKTQLALQLGYCCATGLPWLGIEVAPCKALYYGAEDPVTELCYRYKQIQKAIPSAGIEKGAFGLITVADDDAELALFDKDGSIQPTQRFRELDAILTNRSPKLLILDAAADVMGGDEINRRQVRSFFRLLRSLALKHSCAILLLAHPSVDGMKTGRGYSGSTHWNNAARSRLYLTTPTEDGEAVDTDLRQLTLEKSNRAKRGLMIAMRWQDGVFVRETLEDASEGIVIARAKSVFLEILSDFNRQGRRVGVNSGHNYAPAVFEQEPKAAGMKRKFFQKAMSALLQEERIVITKCGSPSKPRDQLEVA